MIAVAENPVVAIVSLLVNAIQSIAIAYLAARYGAAVKRSR